MSTVTFPLKDYELEALQKYTSKHGTSVEELMTQEARRIIYEKIQAPMQSHIDAITGIAPPDVDLEAEYKAYLEAKYA